MLAGLALASAAMTVGVDLEAPGMAPIRTTLVVTDNDEASYNFSIEQSGEKGCAPEPAGFTRSVGLSLSRPDADDADRISLSLSWSRRISGSQPQCADAQTRSATLNQTVVLQPAQSQTMVMDGGLTLKLQRK